MDSGGIIAFWTLVAAGLTAVATVAAAAITAWFNLKSTRIAADASHIREEHRSLKKQVEALLHEIAAFHACEDVMTQRLIEHEGSDYKTTKGKYRDAIGVEILALHGRPSMTRKRCEKRLSELRRGFILNPTITGNES